MASPWQMLLNAPQARAQEQYMTPMVDDPYAQIPAPVEPPPEQMPMTEQGQFMLSQSMQMPVQIDPRDEVRRNMWEAQVRGTMDKYQKQADETLQDEQRANDQYAQYIENVKARPEGFDFRPLAQLSDWFNETPNSSISQAASMMKPMSKAEKDAMLMDLQNKLQLRKEASSRNALSALSKSLEEYKLLKPEDPLAMAFKKAQAQAMMSKVGTKFDDRIEADVQKLGKSTQGVADLNNALAIVDEKLGFPLDQFDRTTKTVNGQPVDLPGVSVPGIGRVSAHSSQARDLNAAASRVFNTELKDRSGAAVTNQELTRLKDEFAAGRFNTEEELLTALQDYKRLLLEELKNREAAFRPEVVRRFTSRGGTTSGGISQPARSTQQETKTWGGKTYKKLPNGDWVEAN